MMKRLRGFTDRSEYAQCCLSIGNFDGVHLGHQQILDSLVSLARQHSVPAVVLTFEPHPAALLHPEKLPPRLTTPDQKAELLAERGVDVLIEYPTDWALLKLSPQDFFEQIVVTELQVRGLVEGPNFFFGHKRAGNVEILEGYCKQTGRELIVVPSTKLGEDVVSSSMIRKALSLGDVNRAEKMLQRRYTVRGRVKVGAQRGRTLGFPTANLEEIATLLPADGVYAAWCHLPEGRVGAAVSIGPNPTFSEMRSKVEAHLLGFSGDLYGKILELEFVSRLRDLQSYGSAVELQTQIRKDLKKCQLQLET